MPALFWARAGALMMLLSVAAGAFGAHALRETLSPDMKAVYETAARYQAYHALALLLLAALADKLPERAVTASGWCFLGGIVLFSGSLYALGLSGVRKLGAITPLGGLLFLLGWLVLLLGSRRA
jgi:uncharacterized membrane protein YgdD (TMEM256/DUF423 family)